MPAQICAAFTQQIPNVMLVYVDIFTEQLYTQKAEDLYMHLVHLSIAWLSGTINRLLRTDLGRQPTKHPGTSVSERFKRKCVQNDLIIKVSLS